MRISVSVTDFSWPGSTTSLAAQLADVARTAEDAGLDTVWVADHLLQANPRSSIDEPMLEAYTTLGYLTAQTRRIRREHRAGVRPRDGGQVGEDAVQAQAVGLHEQARERVQTQVGVGGGGHRSIQIDAQLHELDGDAAALVGAGVRTPGGGGGLGVIRLLGAEAELREPGVQHRAVRRDRTQTDAPYRALTAHASTVPGAVMRALPV